MAKFPHFISPIKVGLGSLHHGELKNCIHLTQLINLQIHKIKSNFTKVFYEMLVDVRQS